MVPLSFVEAVYHSNLLRQRCSALALMVLPERVIAAAGPAALYISFVGGSGTAANSSSCEYRLLISK